MPKYDLNKVALPANLLHIFRIPFLRNTFGWLLLIILCCLFLLKIIEDNS